MKLALVIFAVLGLSSAMPSAKSTKDLQGDLEDIIGLIPLDEIRAIAREYAANDEEFRDVVRYLQGPEWAELVQTVADHPTWQKFKVYMAGVGIDVDGVIQFIHDLINGLDVGKQSTGKGPRGIRDFVDEVLALIDAEALLAALNDKLNNSPDFQEFFEKISSQESYEMVEEIRALPEVQRIAQELRDMGIDVDFLIDLIYGLLGWNKKMTTRDLQSDLEDIIGLIPLDEIRAIARRYAESDEEFRDVVRYLQGPEWAELVQTVADHPTWQKFKVYMAGVGIDVDGVIQFIHDLINGLDVGKQSTGKGPRGIRDFVDEVLALIDTEALLAALNDKLNNSPDFQEFFEKISSQESYEMVEEIRALPEVQRIAQELRDMGIDVDFLIDLIYGLLGWSKKMTTRDLQSDLEDIIGLIPLDEIRAIARRYAESDEEFRDVVRYLQGPEWAELVQTVADHPTWQKFKVYMAGVGIDVDGVIQFIHDLINGLDVGKQSTGKGPRGIRDFVDEVLALIDTEALLAALNDKLNNSPDFQEFFEKISSQESYEMVEEIRALPEVQRIAQELRDMGIDVDFLIDLIYGLLGWSKKMTTRDLQSDLEDIIGLIPLDEIRAIARRYAESDEEFRDVVRYLQGPEWAELVQTVADHPTWQKFKVYMAGVGIDVDGVIQFIHDLINGLDVGKQSTGKGPRGIRDFVDEVLALIDAEALLAALNDKLNNSPDFQEFFEKISSQESYEMVEEIRALPEVQRIAQELRDMGIDVDFLIDLIYGLLGWSKKMTTRDLQSDLEDIIGLIPLDEIRAIARRYAESDEEFRDVVRYLQGPEWAELVQTVADHPTWQKFKVYMAGVGIDVDGVIQFIHDLINGLDVGKQSTGKGPRGIRDFVDEVLALIDAEALLAALNDKLNNSPDFQEFFEKISSQESYEMVEEIRALPEVQRIAQELRDMGIDVDFLIDLIYGLLGWNK